MSKRKGLKKMFLPLLLMILLVTLAGCGKKGEGTSPTAVETGSVTGIYTNTITGEEMRDRLVASWSAVTHLDTLVQNNVLVLTAENTTITGDRYELSKELYNGEMGIHIEAHFYGEYVEDGTTVTLKTPEYYTWIYYRNGQIMGDAHVYEPVNPDATGNDGASFFGDYLDYHGYHRIDEMNVTVNKADGTFEFAIETDEDTAEIGTESEDDGFQAGPIFYADDSAEESTENTEEE